MALSKSSNVCFSFWLIVWIFSSTHYFRLLQIIMLSIPLPRVFHHDHELLFCKNIYLENLNLNHRFDLFNEDISRLVLRICDFWNFLRKVKTSLWVFWVNARWPGRGTGAVLKWHLLASTVFMWSANIDIIFWRV